MEIPDNLVKTIATVLVGGTVVTGSGFGGKRIYDMYQKDHDLLMKIEEKVESLQSQVSRQWRIIGGINE